MMQAQIRFIDSDKDKAKFFSTLRQRVDAYFKENKISKHANAQMVISVCPRTRCLDGKILFRGVLKKMIVRFTGVNERLFFLTQRRKWSFRPNTN